VVGVLSPADLLSEDGQCAIINPYYLVYGSLSAFFCPLTIMLVTFILTVRLLEREATQLADDGQGGVRPKLRLFRFVVDFLYSTARCTTSCTTDPQQIESLHRIRNKRIHRISKVYKQIHSIPTCHDVVQLIVGLVEQQVHNKSKYWSLSMEREATQLAADGQGGMRRCTAERKAYPQPARTPAVAMTAATSTAGGPPRRPTMRSSWMSRFSRSEAPTTTSMLPSPNKFPHETALPLHTTSGHDVDISQHPVDREVSKRTSRDGNVAKWASSLLTAHERSFRAMEMWLTERKGKRVNRE